MTRARCHRRDVALCQPPSNVTCASRLERRDVIVGWCAPNPEWPHRWCKMLGEQ